MHKSTPVTLNFQFVTRFSVPARQAYRWATDFRPGDLLLMGRPGTRTVRPLSTTSLILDDRFSQPDGSRILKRKLIHLHPQRMMWTNTRLNAPNRHSQFIYEIVPDGPHASHLVFTGALMVEVADAKTARVQKLSRQVQKEDAATWRTLARAMANDLKGRQDRRPR